MEKKIKIELTELFMAKADWDRCYYGTIKREMQDNVSIVRGKIKVNDGYIYSMATDQKKLGEMLDDLVKFILDFDLHKEGVTTTICGTTSYLN